VARDNAHAPAAPLSARGLALHARVTEALDDDLDTPAALAAVREIARSDLPPDERRWLLLDADLVLGLDLDLVWRPGATRRDLPAGARDLLDARAGARGKRDWERSDALRRDLDALGVDVVDGPDGQVATARSGGHAASRSDR
jgi:cysteinyl-tRNA synthetase